MITKYVYDCIVEELAKINIICYNIYVSNIFFFGRHCSGKEVLNEKRIFQHSKYK